MAALARDDHNSDRTSFREVWKLQDLFNQSLRRQVDDEEELRWAAIERLPTYDRLRQSVLSEVVENGEVVHDHVDVTKMGDKEKRLFMDSIIREAHDDNEGFLQRIRDRIDRVEIEIPKIEIRYENLRIEGHVHTGSRTLPTLFNSTLNLIEIILGLLGLAPTKKRKIQILKDVSGIIKPSRLTLLLGPPGAGKTTFLLALAGKLDKDLKVSGRVTYCGHEFREFVPQRTCAYISQHDLHCGEMTVRETLHFSERSLGVGTRYDLLVELLRREKELGIKPDPKIDAYMKATAMSGDGTSLATDYMLKMLGLDMCADALAGDEMRRGISGGEKKRLTTGEMLVGPAKAFFMDEISTGLDTSTTFQIVKFMSQMVHKMDISMVITLLQPAPETYEMFDDIILLSEGHIVYQGPRGNILEFFESMGFKCPERKAVADFLQEVTSKKDQEQYWSKKSTPYRYIPVPAFVEAFASFHIGKKVAADLSVPYDRSKPHPAALVTEKYGLSKKELFKTCFHREWLLMKRNGFLHIFKVVQITFMSLIAMTVFLRTTMPYGELQDGGRYYGVLFFSLVNVMFNGMAELAMTVLKLPVFYKQRDFLFYPPWAFVLPIWILRIPISLIESAIWVILTYYTVGFAPAASRFFKQYLAFFTIHQMALSLFRFIAAVGRTQVISSTFATFTLLLVCTLGGFIVSRNDIGGIMIWGCYLSPMTYGQNALVINEFLDERWSAPNIDPRIDAPTVGKVLLKARGFFTEDYMFWVCIGALVGFSFLFNILFICALIFLNPLGDSKAVVLDEAVEKIKISSEHIASPGSNMDMKNASCGTKSTIIGSKTGMVLPFRPISLAFNNINYYVDMPSEMKSQGAKEDRLQLLSDVSGAFRPGILTALVGVTGAGKTTLMDVLAGRKTGGYIEGSVSVSGHPKNQATFARVCGYCEQNDIHSPYVTVYESVLFSAWLRLSSDGRVKVRKMFVEEVVDLVELNPIRNSLVGLPGVDGLSTEQRKRLTIAVELVANPSIIFMDEPTSGLDARAAAIVMRTVRNTVDTGRTVVCTIHQPSIDIFEAFDELLLMKKGGKVIYVGPLGRHSCKLIEYFESIPGISKIKEGYNPATWMLEISAPSVEELLNIDFADIYSKSILRQKNQELIQELSTPSPGSEDLYFPTEYSLPFFTQCKACFWKQYWSYWRNPQYNGLRLLMTIMMGVLFGLIFRNKGQQMKNQQDLSNLMGAMYASILFLGASNAASVQTIVAIERLVFYRERAAKMYSALPYAFAQVAIEVIYVTMQSLIYCLLLYSMIGFEWKMEKVLWFYYYMLMCFIYFTMYGMMIIALTPGYQIAAVVMSFFISFWNLFAGFLIPRPQIPLWWRWYYWASPMSWTLYGLVTSQVGDKNILIEVPGAGNVPLKLYLKGYMGFDYDFLPIVAVAHVCWVVFFFFVFAYGIKFLNFQRR